jgi:hypothetical protein
VTMRFEYCECGCHGSVANVGEMAFTIFDDLKGNFTLYQGHGRYGIELGKSKDYRALTKIARDKARKVLRRMIKDLEA